MEKIAKINPKYRDNLFVSLFGHCIDAKENFLSLYNAIHGTNLKIGETKIEPVMLENVVYNSQYNDVSMLINGKLIVLAEHQSTVNSNMPLRCLEYVARSFEKLFPERKKYNSAQIKLPCPEFYVFYNGKQPFPKEKTMKLSDAFLFEEAVGMQANLDLTVKVFNINYSENSEILQKSKPLMDYAKFVHYATEERNDGTENYIGAAIKRCKKEKIMVEYFEHLNLEDQNMIFGDWDWEECLAVRTEEALEEGYEKGRIEGRLDGVRETALENARKMIQYNIPHEQVLDITGISEDDYKKLLEEAK